MRRAGIRVPEQFSGYGFLHHASRPWTSPRLLAVIAGVAGPLLPISGSWLDGTWRLPDDGKGLADHYGFWFIFASTPLLILLTGHLLDSFAEVLRRSRSLVADDACPAMARRFEALVKLEARSVALRSRSRYILYFSVLIGFLYTELNVIKTFDPVPTYNHDVFDAWSHSYGYFATKIYLLPIFVAVYPVAIFVAAHVTWSSTRVLRFLSSHQILKIDVFHPDRCGGTSPFGYLNVLVMAVYALLLGVVVSMFLTHETTYFVTRSALIFCSIALLTQSVAGVYAIHRSVSLRKRELLGKLTAQLTSVRWQPLEADITLTSGLLSVRDHVDRLHTFPYAARVRVAVNVLRFAPAAIALTSLLGS